MSDRTKVIGLVVTIALILFLMGWSFILNHSEQVKKDRPVQNAQSPELTSLTVTLVGMHQKNPVVLVDASSGRCERRAQRKGPGPDMDTKDLVRYIQKAMSSGGGLRKTCDAFLADKTLYFHIEAESYYLGNESWTECATTPPSQGRTSFTPRDMAIGGKMLIHTRDKKYVPAEILEYEKGKIKLKLYPMAMDKPEIPVALTGHRSPGERLAHLKKEIAENPHKCIDKIIAIIKKYGHVSYAFEGPSRHLVEGYLRAGLDINTYSSTGELATVEAARRCQKVTVDLLLQYGADINAKDKQGDTPLIAACQGRLSSTSVVKRFKYWKADPFIRDSNGKIAYDYATQHRRWERLQPIERQWLTPKADNLPHIMFACEASDVETVKLILKSGRNIPEVEYARALQKAMDQNCFPIVELLAPKCPKHTPVIDRTCFEGHDKILEYILKNRKYSDDEICRQIISLSRVGWRSTGPGSKEEFQSLFNCQDILLNTLNYNALDSNKKFELTNNIWKEARPEITKAFAKKAGLKIPTWVLARIDEVEALKDKIKEDPDCIKRLYFEETLLFWAAKYGALNTARFLLDQKVDTEAGKSLPLAAAVRSYNKAMVKLLVENGAKLEYLPKDNESEDQTGSFSVLCDAILCGDSTMLETVLKLGANPNLKLRLRRKPNTTDRNYFLHLARRDPKMVEILKTYGAKE